jgi:hypothetical protein
LSGFRNPGVRSLTHARLYGSTSRILDIPRLIERFQANGQKPSVPAVVFQTKLLNRAFIIKHSIRKYERDIFDHNNSSSTKIIFPFAASDLNQGGASIFVDERYFTEKMMKFIGLSSIGDAYARDEKLLFILNGIPSFDPFLIAERARFDGIELPLGLIDLSDHDLTQLREMVAKSLSQITALALPEGAAEASSKFASAFLASRDDKRLDPLRAAMSMSQGDFQEAIFAWKGILYYQWKLEDSSSFFSDIVSTLSQIKPIDRGPDIMRTVRLRSHHIVRTLNHSMIALAEALMGYQEVIRKLTEDRDPRHLGNFLKNAKSMFAQIGENSSIINHCTDFWGYAMRGVNWSLLTSEKALEILNSLAASLPEQNPNDRL